MANHKKKSKRNSIMGRSDIPFAQRMSMKHQADIAYNRERSARNYMYCLCKTLNEEEGIGYKRLVTFSIAFMNLINEFYEDQEVGMAHIKQRLAQHGIEVSGEFYSAKLSEATSKEQAVYDHAMQSVHAAQLVGAVAMNDVFGFGKMRQQRLRTSVQKQTERYSKEGESFLLEAMEKIGFKVEGDQVRAFVDQEGNPVSVSRAKKEGWNGKYGT